MSDDPTVQAWRRLLAQHAAATCALDRELGDLHGLSVSEFEVLERLVEAPEKLRIQELASEIHLSQSATTRVVARLEKDGLLCRTMCDMDRRGVYACISDDGRARYAEARPTQRRVLSEQLDGAPAAV
jgi:DNA-binding MarR family transcriptional regulator